jgi:heterotetrameric sarcosine oxidase gamma subunit
MADPLVSIASIPRATRLSIRAGTDAAAAIGGALSVSLDHIPCRATQAGDRAALWLGPDEWLLLAPEAEAPALFAAAESARGTLPASIVDVSHRSVAFEVSGTHTTDVLNAFCALDLHVDAFPVGACSRTLFGKAEIVLWRTAPDTFRVETARSFAAYVHDCLAEAAREFSQAQTVT